MPSPLRWLARKSFGKVLLLALLWPLFVVVIAALIAAVIAAGLPEASNFAVSAGGPGVAILLLGPPALLIILWMVARRGSTQAHSARYRRPGGNR